MSNEILDGPDWLEEQASRHNGQGHDLEADQLRRLAKAWRLEREAQARLQAEASGMQLQLNTIRRAAAELATTH